MRWIPLVFCAACGGASAESPLTVSLGLTHDATEQALHAHQFCREPGQVNSDKEVFPRCDRAAAEVSDAWVQAIFDHDRLVELRRFERFTEDARAVERWNELVAQRMKSATPSDEAVQQLRDKGLLPAGTRTVKAFRGEGDTVIGVYLLTPTEPERANVLEQISYVKQ